MDPTAGRNEAIVRPAKNSLPRHAATFALAILLIACPPPPEARLYNRTDVPVRYCSGWRCSDVAPGATSRVRFTHDRPFRFSIRSAGRKLSYAIAEPYRPAYGRYARDSNCPGCPRYVFQLEPDLRIFILEPGLEPPVPILPSQPEGFPLVPDEGDA